MEFLDLSSDVAVRQWLYQQVLATHTGDAAWAEAAHGGSPTMSMLYVVRAARPPASSRPPSSPRRPAASCASSAARLRVRLPRLRFSSMTALMRRVWRTAASSATSPRRPSRTALLARVPLARSRGRRSLWPPSTMPVRPMRARARRARRSAPPAAPVWRAKPAACWRAARTTALRRRRVRAADFGGPAARRPGAATPPSATTTRPPRRIAACRATSPAGACVSAPARLPEPPQVWPLTSHLI